ncbi:MAG: phosphoenolpyruvate--protein phosphotransferase [Acidobacteria bacterium]|nr:phosphoenolpyruvate--protein phosphotransferase [Acidobacteriota bacterium]
MRQLRLKGLGVSPGIAMGRAFILEQTEVAPAKVALSDAAEVDEEIQRFHRALHKSREQLLTLKERIASEVGGEHAYIFDAQILMLQDELLIGKTETKVRAEKVNVEWALQDVKESFDEIFRALEDAYIADRISDIGDVIRRVQVNLGHQQLQSLEGLQEKVVLVARDLTPSQAAQIEKSHVIGLAIDTASRTSHSIILARSLKIPAVIALHDLYFKVRNDDLVLVDGTEGEVVLNPPAAMIKEYFNKKQKYEDYQKELLKCAVLPSVTLDGVSILLQANIESALDIPFAVRCGAEGIGLFRTDYMILNHETGDPGESEQYEVYAEVARNVAPHSSVIRTADLGGDKVTFGDQASYARENNPILGLRAVRLCLKHRDFFKRQLRALLRAGSVGDLRILIPMVSGIGEIRQVKRLLEECQAELAAEGVPLGKRIPLGVMIEVPAAVAIADLLAREVDFFSIGTNDLIQHTLAVDRDNDSVSYLYEPLHPAILRSLERVLKAAADVDIRVNLCGEAASEPIFALIMIGLGLREFSMNPALVPVIKRVIRAVRVDALRDIAIGALERPTAQEVEEYVLERLVARFPDALMTVPGGVQGGG